MLNELFSKLFDLAANTYHVNPLIFLAIYILSIPIFFLSLYEVVRRVIALGESQDGVGVGHLKRDKKLFLWAIVLLIDYLSPYLYVLLFGKNIPIWVYILLFAIIGLSVRVLMMKVKKKISSK